MSNTPNIRFKGFTNPWEQREFEEIAVRSSSLGTDMTLPRVEYEDIISGIGQLNKDIYAKSSKKTGIVFHEGDVLYGKLRPYLKNWLLPSFSGIAVGDFWVLQPQHIDSGFVYRLLQTRQFDEVANQSTGTKMPRADWNLVSKTRFHIPSSVDEQVKIGAYFTSLDNLISLHERKYNEMSELKKFMLQKMFPKNGERFPEIRCKGFTEPWKRCNLRDYLDVSEQKNKDEQYDKEDVLSVSGEFGIVNQIEFQGRSFAGESVANYGVVETGDIVYTKSPLKSNPYGIIKTNKGKTGIVSTLYAVYKPKEIVDSKFVQIYFEQDARMNNYMQPLVNKGAKNDMKVSAENALKGAVIFPTIEEQRKISEYFEKFDILITLHQRKCDEIKEFKKFMLQNMFPKKG